MNHSGNLVNSASANSVSSFDVETPKQHSIGISTDKPHPLTQENTSVSVSDSKDHKDSSANRKKVNKEKRKNKIKAQRIRDKNKFENFATSNLKKEECVVLIVEHYQSKNGKKVKKSNNTWKILEHIRELEDRAYKLASVNVVENDDNNHNIDIDHHGSKHIYQTLIHKRASIGISRNGIVILLHTKAKHMLDVPFKEIAYIDERNLPGYTQPSSQHLLEREFQKRKMHFTKLHLAGEEMIIFIYTFESMYLANKIEQCWHSNLVCTVANIDILEGENRIDDMTADAAYQKLTRDYCKHIYKAITNANSPVDLIDKIREFGAEVLIDLKLKETILKSKDIIIQCIRVLRYMLFAPVASDFDPEKDLPGREWDENFMNEYGKFMPSNTQERNHLRFILFQRLRVVHHILNFLTAICVSSEFLDSRYNLLQGPYPLELQSWVSLFVPDLYNLITETLGGDIDNTLFNINDDNSADIRAGQGIEPVKRASIKINKVNLEKIADVENIPFVGYSDSIAILREGITDLQNILLNEVFRVSSLCRALLFKNSGISGQRLLLDKESRIRMADAQSPAEAVIRVENWESRINELIKRIQTILDTIITDASMVRKMQMYYSKTDNFDAKSPMSEFQFAKRLSMKGRFGLQQLAEEESHLGSSGSSIEDLTARTYIPTSARITSNQDYSLGNGSVYNAFETPRAMSSTPRAVGSTPRMTPRLGNIPYHRTCLYEDGVDVTFVEEEDLNYSDSDDEMQFDMFSPYEENLSIPELFYSIRLLKSLVFDSGQIRQELISDKFQCSFLVQIIAIFNIICPRPIQNVEDRLGNRQNIDEKVVQNPKLAPQSNCSNGITGFISSIFKKKSKNEETLSINNEMPSSTKSSIHAMSEVSRSLDIAMADEDEKELKEMEKNIDRRHLTTIDYGPPKFDLHYASWILIVLSRILMEETITLLKIETTFTAKPPDQKQMNDLSKSAWKQPGNFTPLQSILSTPRDSQMSTGKPLNFPPIGNLNLGPVMGLNSARGLPSDRQSSSREKLTERDEYIAALETSRTDGFDAAPLSSRNNFPLPHKSKSPTKFSNKGLRKLKLPI